MSPADVPHTAARRAFAALGSNRGDRMAYLRGAVDGFDDVVSLGPLRL